MSSKRGRSRVSGAASSRNSSNSTRSPSRSGSESKKPSSGIAFEYETEDGLKIKLEPNSIEFAREYELNDTDFIEFSAGIDWTPIDYKVEKKGLDLDISGSAKLPGNLLGVSGGIVVDLGSGEISGGEVGVALGGIEVSVAAEGEDGCKKSIGISFLGVGISYGRDDCDDDDDDDDDYGEEAKNPRNYPFTYPPYPPHIPPPPTGIPDPSSWPAEEGIICAHRFLGDIFTNNHALSYYFKRDTTLNIFTLSYPEIDHIPFKTVLDLRNPGLSFIYSAKATRVFGSQSYSGIKQRRFSGHPNFRKPQYPSVIHEGVSIRELGLGVGWVSNLKIAGEFLKGSTLELRYRDTSSPGLWEQQELYIVSYISGIKSLESDFYHLARQPKRNPPSSPPRKINPMDKCCRDSIKLTREIHKALDVREMLTKGVETPNRWIAAGGKKHTKNKTYLELMVFQMRMMDHLGIHPFTAQVTDINAAQEGNQSVAIEFANATAAAKQIAELLLENKGDSATRLNLMVRTAVAVGQILNVVSIIAKTLEGIVQYLGMPIRERIYKVKMPFDFTFGARKKDKSGQGFGKKPGAGSDALNINTEEATEALLPVFMQDSEQPITVEDFDDREGDLTDIIRGK